MAWITCAASPLLEKLNPLVHVLPITDKWQLPVEIAQVEARLLLPVAYHGAKQFLDVHKLKRFLIDAQTSLPVAGSFLNAIGALAKARIDATLEQIKRFKEMAVRINRRHVAHLLGEALERKRCYKWLICAVNPRGWYDNPLTRIIPLGNAVSIDEAGPCEYFDDSRHYDRRKRQPEDKSNVSRQVLMLLLLSNLAAVFDPWPSLILGIG